MQKEKTWKAAVAVLAVTTVVFAALFDWLPFTPTTAVFMMAPASTR